MHKKFTNDIMQGHADHARSKGAAKRAVERLLSDRKVSTLPKDGMKDVKSSLKIKEYKPSIVSKYVNNKIKSKLNEDVMGGLGAASQLLGSYSMALGQTNMLLGLGAAVTGILNKAYKDYKFDNQGCQNIVEPNQRLQCEQRALDRVNSSIMNQKAYCRNSQDPQGCEAKLMAEIQKNNQKKLQLQQTLLPQGQ